MCAAAQPGRRHKGAGSAPAIGALKQRPRRMVLLADDAGLSVGGVERAGPVGIEYPGGHRRRLARAERFAALAAYVSAVFNGLDMRDSSQAVELDTLMLAGDTGGLNLGPELSTALASVLRDQRGYYLAGLP